MAERKPVIGVASCVKHFDATPFHAAGDKYVRAASHGAGGIPFVIPALGEWYDTADLLDRLDGLMLTGSPSNVEPRHYDGTPSRAGTEHDAERDATTLPLIRHALQMGVPLIAICRGIQELNVALGGTLHQLVHELPGKQDHRSRKDVPMAQRYEPVHEIVIAPGTALAALAGGVRTHAVNSLHAQAIDRPADRIAVEAVSPDGVIEAVAVKDARAFAMGFQWHPEWRFWEDTLSTAIFRAFGEACRMRAARRLSRQAIA